MALIGERLWTDRHNWENFLNTKDSQVRNRMPKLFSNAYTTMLFPYANIFQEYLDKVDPVMVQRKKNQICPSKTFPGERSSVIIISSLPVWSACFITPYQLLCLPPLFLPSPWVHGSSASCLTCRPCLSMPSWGPAATSSWQYGRDTLLFQLGFFQTVFFCYLLSALPSSGR